MDNVSTLSISHRIEPRCQAHGFVTVSNLSEITEQSLHVLQIPPCMTPRVKGRVEANPFVSRLDGEHLYSGLGFYCRLMPIHALQLRVKHDCNGWSSASIVMLGVHVFCCQRRI